MGAMSELHIKMSEVDNIVIEGVDSSDYPKFCDAFIASAYYKNRECTEEELEWIMENYPERINELAYQSLIP